jgi:nucleoid-associated protein YgaU
VILLVFALGFLVYQKVERHEQQLTQAAIPSQSETSKQPASEQPVVAAATASSPAELVATSESSVADPLAEAGSMEQSPFAETGGEPEVAPAIESDAATSPVFAFTEPAADTPELLAVNTPESGFDATPVQPEDSSQPEVVPSELPVENNRLAAITPSGIEEGAESSAAPMELAVPLEEPALAPSVVARSESAGIPDTAQPPDFSLDLNNTVAAESTEPEIPGLADATELQPSMTVEPPEPTLLTPELTEPPASTEPFTPTEQPTPTEPIAAVEQPEFGEPAEPTIQVAQPSEEPQLLALAEPQEATPFGSEFNPGRVSSGGEAASTPAFRAVTRPSAVGKGNTGAGAAGSAGADRDGRFSLAAFNSQNAAVQAGVDDGEKHKSVIVQNGENYSKISKRVYGTTRYFSALAVFNQHRIANPNSMRPGMIVLTPEAKLLEERYPQLFLDRQPKVEAPSGFLLLDDGSPAYRVGARETLSEISERFLGRSSRWVEIYELNRSALPDPNTLKPGLVLALPEDATEVQLVP